MMALMSSMVTLLLCNTVMAQSVLQQLQTCLGPISTYLVTSTYTYNTANPYYSFSWLQTGSF